MLTSELQTGVLPFVPLPSPSSPLSPEGSFATAPRPRPPPPPQRRAAAQHRPVPCSTTGQFSAFLSRQPPSHPAPIPSALRGFSTLRCPVPLASHRLLLLSPRTPLVFLLSCPLPFLPPSEYALHRPVPAWPLYRCASLLPQPGMPLAVFSSEQWVSCHAVRSLHFPVSLI